MCTVICIQNGPLYFFSLTFCVMYYVHGDSDSFKKVQQYLQKQSSGMRRRRSRVAVWDGKALKRDVLTRELDVFCLTISVHYWNANATYVGVRVATVTENKYTK